MRELQGRAPQPLPLSSRYDELLKRAKERSAKLCLQRKEATQTAVPVQMFLPGFDIGAFPNHLNQSCLITPIARGLRKSHRQAKEGDKAAIAQLRAFNYADKKKQREQQRRDDELATLPGIQSAKRADDDPMVWRKTAELAWRVNRTTGDVACQMAGREVFTDHGRRLTLTATGSSEAQAILLALEMARQKYGQELTLTGSDEFKRRAVAIAVQNRLDVSFTDPALNALKADLAQPAIVQKDATKAPTTPAQELATLKTHYEASGFKLASKDEKTGIKSRAGHEFTGAIVHVGQHFVVQRTGANTLVAHPRAQLPRATVGKLSVTVQYGSDGRAKIVTRDNQKIRGIQR